MPIQGNLRTMPVPELLMWISQFRKTGTLEIRTALSTERLAFENGTLTYSSSSDRKKTLGRLLIEKGVLTEEMHEKARTLRKKNVAVAKALIELEMLSEQDLLRFLRKKAESELFDLFECIDGEFGFNELEMPQLQLLPLRVDVSNLLLRLTQKMDEKGEYDFDDASGLHWERLDT
ncbi:MAG TPA: DUF4388 domain-containing protein [Thermoanaerobaculia bacterium]|nr:DUF4388 domain-containing protein [Thermoanaerobaculia bacterium]